MPRKPPPKPKNPRPKKPKAVAALQVVPKKYRGGQRCSICAHDELKNINLLINEGKSFRRIASQILGSENRYRSISRHVEKCLNLEINALIRKNRINNAIDHYAELLEQLDFAKELQTAAKEWLSDPKTGRISFMPRADELDIIYLDGHLLDLFGRPTRQRQSLQDIIDNIQQVAPNIKVIGHTYKTSDTREYAVKTIAGVDSLLDKFAKVEGHYQKDKDAAEETFEKVVSAFSYWLEDNQTVSESEKAKWLQRFALGAGVEAKRLARHVGVKI
ncbi:MAG TPA: hypothetical protein VNI84_18935 [Pyrinomonadaceae bacterium]|nr:hypothetical protein [Pyrinomonadaceae bacterium]